MVLKRLVIARPRFCKLLEKADRPIIFEGGRIFSFRNKSDDNGIPTVRHNVSIKNIDDGFGDVISYCFPIFWKKSAVKPSGPGAFEGLR